MALPRSLERLRWLLIGVPPLATAAALAVQTPAPRAESRHPPLEAQPRRASTSHRSRGAIHTAVVVRQPKAAAGQVEESAEYSPEDSPEDSPVDARDDSPESKQNDLAAASPTQSGREIFFGPAGDNRVALTFDDGPSEELTPWVLNTLREHGVRATFFVLGNRAKAHPEVLAAIDADGHEIGNHGWSHSSLRSLYPQQIERELDDTNAAVFAATGKTPTLFRPPFGRYPKSSIALVAARAMDIVLWNADGRDWDGDADAVVQRVVSQARPGAIILLHDRETATARALPRILEGLANKGLEPVPVTELLGPAPPSLTPPDTDRTQ